MMRSSRFALSALVLVASACGGGGSGSTNPPPPSQTLGSLVATPPTVALTAGHTQAITVQALDTDNHAIAGIAGFTFTTDHAAIADISTTGTVLGFAAGAATINVSVTLNGVTKSTTVPVTVTGTLPVTGTVAAGGASATFSPTTLIVAQGGVVTFTFGALAHTVTFDPAAGVPANIGTSSNAVVTRTFGTAGDFSFICSIHGAAMHGTVIVR